MKAGVMDRLYVGYPHARPFDAPKAHFQLAQGERPRLGMGG